MVLISIIITLLYLVLIGCFAFGFDKVPVFKLKAIEPKTTFSVIIPFRNEAEHLPELLRSIETLKYPKTLFEIIFVDDDSDDSSVEIIKKFIDRGFESVYTEHSRSTQPNIKVIANQRASNSPKKDAITTAIKQAKNTWVLTTDADCVLPKYWLDSFDGLIQNNNPKCIVAPVSLAEENSFLNRFQTLDVLSLQAATVGGFGINKPFLCNGANLAYTKDLFKDVNGFEDNTNCASGDDIFLLEKAVKAVKKSVCYLKCEHAIVSTKAQPTWSALKQQRVRWAAKTSAYKNTFAKLTGVIVVFMNALLMVLLALSALNQFSFKSFVYIVIIKCCIDFLLIYKSASFFNQNHLLKTYLFGFLIYPFFSVYMAFIALFKGYKWKERHFKK